MLQNCCFFFFKGDLSICCYFRTFSFSRLWLNKDYYGNDDCDDDDTDDYANDYGTSFNLLLFLLFYDYDDNDAQKGWNDDNAVTVVDRHESVANTIYYIN